MTAAAADMPVLNCLTNLVAGKLTASETPALDQPPPRHHDQHGPDTSTLEMAEPTR